MLVICLMASACKKFLEKEPINRTGKLTLFETVDGAKLAINGAYNLMLTYNRSEFGLYGDLSSDNVIKSATATTALPLFNFTSTPGDDEFAAGHIWLNIYSALNNVNNILEAVPGLKTKFPAQTSTLDSIYGQGLVMRALCHFDLSRTYAQPYNFTADASHLGVPVLTKTPSPGAEVPRNTIKETYAQIVTDLQAALPFLQQYANHTDQASISYQAALALLSRVYLYQGNWAQAASYATMVINDPVYKLADQTNYKSQFLNTNTKGANPKIGVIFQYNNIPSGSSIPASTVFPIYSDATGAQYTASSKLLSLYDADDLRANLFFVPSSGQNIGKVLSTKYGNGSLSTTTLTIKVIRLAELYLNRAEADWNLGKYTEAAEDLRIISQQAHPNRVITITYPSNADLYRQIADERNRELCFENHRFFDLVRRKENLVRGGDCNATTCSLTYPNNKFVLPITVKELEANHAIIPNPGYN